MEQNQSLVKFLMQLPIFEAEWVLWLLIGLSVISVGIMIERTWFYFRHKINSEEIRTKLQALLENGDYDQAASLLNKYDSLETNIVLFGLRQYRKGADSVETLIRGAHSREKLRYVRRLSFLATIGSNAPFIGLFGTVLGIIRAFQDLSDDMANASGTVMAGISEALIATAVGLLVAIPAVIAYNTFNGRVKNVTANAQLLSDTLLAQLKSEEESV